MTHKQPAAYGSPVFRIYGATPLPASPCFPCGHTEGRRREGTHRRNRQPRGDCHRHESGGGRRHRVEDSLQGPHRVRRCADGRGHRVCNGAHGDRLYATTAPERTLNPELTTQETMHFSTMCILENHESWHLIRTPTTGEHHEEKPESSGDGCRFGSCRCRDGHNVCA